jgi:hypothetical protein
VTEPLKLPHSESDLSIADRLADALDHRPRGNLIPDVIRGAARLSKAAVVAIVCVTASITIWATGLRLIAGLDLREVVSNKVTTTTKITDPMVKHTPAIRPELHPAQESPKQPPSATASRGSRNGRSPPR